MKIVFVLMLSVALVSCANFAQQLPGEWRYADAIQSCDYVFNHDGTFAGEVRYRGMRVSQFTGKWSLEGDQLHYQYTRDRLHNIPAGTKDADKLLVVTDNYFIIEVSDGSRRKYLRIK